MSAIEINKIAGAVLCALLLLLSVSFVVELAAGHPEGGEPVFVVAAPAARAPTAAAASPAATPRNISIGRYSASIPHVPETVALRPAVAGVTGLEPAASGVTGQRSNRLSYTP